MFLLTIEIPAPVSSSVDRFWQQKWSGKPILAKFSAKIGPGGPTLGGTDRFGVTAPSRPHSVSVLPLLVYGCSEHYTLSIHLALLTDCHWLDRHRKTTGCEFDW